MEYPENICRISAKSRLLGSKNASAAWVRRYWIVAVAMVALPLHVDVSTSPICPELPRPPPSAPHMPCKPTNSSYERRRSEWQRMYQPLKSMRAVTVQTLLPLRSKMSSKKARLYSSIWFSKVRQCCQQSRCRSVCGCEFVAL